MEEKITIPKHVFDKKYSTQWRREVQFLEDKGIAFAYGKKHPKYPVIRYKYTKTPELFLALAEFYNQIRNEKFFKDVENVSKEITPLEKGCIEIQKDDLTQPEQKLMEDVIAVLDSE